MCPGIAVLGGGGGGGGGDGRTEGHEKGQCAEPHALTQYTNHLRSKGWTDEQIRTQGMQDITSITPMEKTGPTAGTFKAPCTYCQGMLGNLNLSGKVQAPTNNAPGNSNIVKGELPVGPQTPGTPAAAGP
jgi:hypothetical protein